MSNQLLSLKTILHFLYRPKIFGTSQDDISPFTKTYTINIMCPCIQKHISLLFLNSEFTRPLSIIHHQRVKIIHSLQQLFSVTLLIIVLIQQFRNQQLAVMSIKHVQTIRLRTGRKFPQPGKCAIRLFPHQTVNLFQLPAWPIFRHYHRRIASRHQRSHH